MIATNFKNFKIKVFNFIIIKPPLYKRFGRHSTTDFPIKNILLNKYKSKNESDFCRCALYYNQTYFSFLLKNGIPNKNSRISNKQKNDYYRANKKML